MKITIKKLKNILQKIKLDKIESSQKICAGCKHFQSYHGSAGFCQLKGCCCENMIDCFDSCKKFKEFPFKKRLKNFIEQLKYYQFMLKYEK